MRDVLDKILASRLEYLDRSSPINFEWVKNLCKYSSFGEIKNEEIIDYLQHKGFMFFSNNVLEKEERLKELETISKVTITTNPKNDRKRFNPNDFLKEIEKEDFRIYSHKDNDYLINQYRVTSDSKYLDRIIEVNIKLVQSIAKKFKNLGHLLEFEDLVQIGIIGLYKAVDKFDETLGYSFSTYATWWIRQRIHREILDIGYIVRLPVHVHEQLNKLKKWQRKSLESRGKLDIEWISNNMGISSHKYNELLKIDNSFSSLASLNGLVSPDGEDTELVELITPSPDLDFNLQLQHYEDPFLEYEKIARTELINDLMENLKEREADILRKRMGYYDGELLTLEEIGMHHNLTRERIRQLEAKALRILKIKIKEKKWEKNDLLV